MIILLEIYEFIKQKIEKNWHLFVATSVPPMVLLVVFALWTWVGILVTPSLTVVSVAFCNPRSIDLPTEGRKKKTTC
jgi:hypothetical protein